MSLKKIITVKNIIRAFVLGLLGEISLANHAFCDVPRAWQINFQEAASPTMKHLHDFHHLLLIIITLITLFVTGLLIYTCIRFRAKRNPIPSKTTHHTLLEVLWTVIPIITLAFIAVPSLKVLFYMDVIPKSELTLKVVGYQWYWGYEYPDNDNIAFESHMVKDDEIKAGQHRLLEVDNRVVLPIETNVRVLITGADVIHSWAIPSLGIKKDAVPGRLNETWVSIDKPGVYYGQCSELCGIGHGFMPIAIEAVTKEEFAVWVEKNKTHPASLEEKGTQHDVKAQSNVTMNFPQKN